MRGKVAAVIAGLSLSLLVRCAAFEGTPEPATEPTPTPTPAPDGQAAGALDAGNAAVRFCADAGGVFCDDFDDDERVDVSARWSALDGGGLALDEGAALSPPRSLVLRTKSFATSGPKQVTSLVFNIPEPIAFPASLRVSLDLRVTVASTDPGHIVPVRVAFGVQGEAVGVALVRDAGTRVHQVTVVDDLPVPMLATAVGPFVKPGEWQRLELDLDRDAKRVTVRLGREQSPLELPLPGDLIGPVRLEIGAPLLDGRATPWTIHFDNVVVDVVR